VISSLNVQTRKLITVAAALLVSACVTPTMKPSDAHIRAEPEKPVANIPPPVQFPIALPKPKPAVKAETYSVVVNNVPVAELLFALARDAKINVDVHPGMRGSVTLNAIDQTLPQLLSRIAKQADMRWELDGPNLLVMPDSPFLRIYKIDYVNLERTSSGQIGVSGQISTGSVVSGSGGGGSGGGNASSAQVQNRSDNKFWPTMVNNVKDILHETDKLIPASGVLPPGGVQAQPAIAAGAPGAVAPGGAANVVQAPAQQGATFREAASVIANAEAGVLIIRATSRQHEKIQEFLDQVLVSAKRQVMIEATIAEVTLNNNFQQGINWNLFRRGPAGTRLAQSATGTTTANPNGSFFVLNYVADSFTASLQLLESFGTVRVLSSPKISVINNQSAILKVVDNLVYFTIKTDTIAATAVGAATTTFTATPNVVPVGFVMNVTPQISSDDTILLNLRPAVTRILSYVTDPTPGLAVANRIPQIQTREMESLIKVSSGETAVMGGLIQDSINNNEDGIPGINRIPGLGELFTQRNNTNSKTELVIFLRPIVVRDASLEGDFRAYRSFLPGQDFLSAPNPGKPILEGARK
jgi:general secretion pathway protein D